MLMSSLFFLSVIVLISEIFLCLSIHRQLSLGGSWQANSSFIMFLSKLYEIIPHLGMQLFSLILIDVHLHLLMLWAN